MGFVWALPIADALTLLLGVILYQIYKKEIFSKEAPRKKAA
jgi:hypothetical protein